MTGSTALQERLDPETVRRVMGRFYEEMRGALENHGGTVEKFIGDAVVGVFGIPQMHEDDALRAVRSAWEMRDRLAALNEELDQRWQVQIGTRTGVNTGEVVAADPERGESFVVGDTLNVAARLEQEAPKGEILIGAPTHRLVRGEVEVEEVEPLTLKGKSEPVPAFRLIGLRDRPSQIARPGAALIGREAELETLEGAMERAIERRRCELMTVIGSAGVGKSRLAEELIRRIEGDARVLQGRCVAYGEGITFWPVAEVLRQAADIVENDGPHETREKLAESLRPGPDRDAIIDRLAGILGAEAGSPHQEEIFWAVRRYLEDLADVGPVAVILEDIHWAEPTLLDLLEYLEDRTADVPLLIVGFARPELREARARLARESGSVTLEPFDAAATRALVADQLGSDDLPEPAIERIEEAAEGNPLFVEEMVQMLVDEDYLRRDGDRWVLVRELAQADVPPSIEALLGARLDRLREHEREVAQRASIAGKVFSRSAVAELSPAPIRTQLGMHLDSLVRKELFDPDEQSFAEAEAFRFHHILIRDAAYRSMLKERRAELHERYAEWLANREHQAEAEHEDLIGHHFEQAYRLREELGPLDDRARKLAEHAGAALDASGRRAGARGDTAAAAKFFERAMAILPAGAPGRGAIGLQLSGALLNAGAGERAREALEEALLESSGDRVLEQHAAVQGGFISLFLDPELDVDGLTAVAEGAIDVFEESGDALGLARAWRLWATVPWRTGRMEETAMGLARAFEHAQASGDDREEADAFAWLVYVHYQAPTPADEAVEMFEGFADRADRDRSGYAGLLHPHGATEVMRGNVDRGRELYGRGQAIFEEMGDRQRKAYGSVLAADAEMNAGDPAAAERLLAPSLEILTEAGDTTFSCETAALLCGALFSQGKIEEAGQAAETSRSTAQAGDVFQQSAWRLAAALMLVAEGKADEAGALAKEGFDLAASTDSPNTVAEAGLVLAGVLMAQGEMNAARDAAERAGTEFERKGNVLGVGRANELAAAAGG